MGEDKTQIFVAKLPTHIDSEGLQDLFEKFGSIRAIDVKKGYAFIEFDEAKNAEEAMEDMDGCIFKGNKLVVKMANKKPRPGTGRGPQPEDKCFECGERGHWANECHRYKRRTRRRRSRSSSSSEPRRRRHRRSSSSPPRKRRSSRDRGDRRERKRVERRSSSSEPRRKTRKDSSESHRNRRKDSGRKRKESNMRSDSSRPKKKSKR